MDGPEASFKPPAPTLPRGPLWGLPPRPRRAASFEDRCPHGADGAASARGRATRPLRRPTLKGTLWYVALSRGGRQLKTTRRPDSGRKKGRVYDRRHWWVVARDGASRLVQNCGHEHALVSEAYGCLVKRPGERVFLVHADELAR